MYGERSGRGAMAFKDNGDIAEKTLILFLIHQNLMLISMWNFLSPKAFYKAFTGWPRQRANFEDMKPLKEFMCSKYPDLEGIPLVFLQVINNTVLYPDHC